MAENIMQPIRIPVDLEAGLVELPQRAHLRYGDKNANQIIAEVTIGGEKADMTGVSASGIFYRPPDGDEVPLTGSISGNIVTVTLNDHCYTQEGAYKADVSLRLGSVVRTILTISGYVKKDGNDVLINVENVVPNINELLMQIQALRDATARANAAADRVEKLQIDASGLAGDSNKLGGKPPEAYTAVNLLDNSDFRNPVNQRGRSGVNLSAGEVIDRWKTWEDGATVYFNHGLYMGLENQNLFQYMPAPYDRGVLTAAVKIYGVDKPYVCTLDTSAVGSASDQHVWLTREAYALSICVVAGAAYEWAAVYEGAYTAETLPPYVTKEDAAELAECRRCFKKIRVMLGAGAATRVLVNFEPMRVIPTTNITVDSSSNDGTVTVNGTSDSNIDIQYSGTWCAATVELDADIK